VSLRDEDGQTASQRSVLQKLPRRAQRGRWPQPNIQQETAEFAGGLVWRLSPRPLRLCDLLFKNLVVLHTFELLVARREKPGRSVNIAVAMIGHKLNIG
jgi:hypothetical protein